MATKNRFIHFKTRAGFDAKMPNPTDSTHDYYNYLVFIKDTKEIYTHGQFYASDMPYVVGTYSEIKQLANNGSLIPNQIYAITDYTYVVRSGYEGQFQSGNNVFAIILKAADPYSFYEDVKALPMDSYFNNCNLNAWEIKYSIHNDNTRHGWAASNGKGVIYYMKDEYGNEAGYDFKNIKFYRNYIDLSNYYNAINGNVVIDGASYSEWASSLSDYGITFPTAMRYASYSTKRTGQEFTDMGLASVGNSLNKSHVYAMYNISSMFGGNIFVKTTGLESSFFYTFSYIPSVSSNWSSVYDATVYSGASSFRPRMNVIEPSFHKVTNSSSVYRLQMLYDNVFIMNGAISPWHSFNNTIKTGAQGNTIDSGCSFNVIGENSSYNIIGEHSQYNTIEKDSNDNILAKRCKHNIISNNSSNNRLWDDSSKNMLGSGCVYNSSFKFSDGNVWGQNCNSCSIIHNYSSNIIFGSGATQVVLSASQWASSSDENNRLQNINILSGLAGAFIDFDHLNYVGDSATIGHGAYYVTSKSSPAQIYPGEYANISYSGNTIEVSLNHDYSYDPFNTNEHSFEFTVGSTVPTLMISGESIRWANDDVPVLESGYKYEISIRNGLAVYAKYKWL